MLDFSTGGPGQLVASANDKPLTIVTSHQRRQALSGWPVPWPHPRLLAYLVLVIGLVLLLAELRQHAFAVNIISFQVANATGIALALMIGLLGISFYQSFNTRSLLFISIGFIGSGIIDGVHLIQALSAYQHLFPELFFQAKAWSALASRLFLAIMLLAGWRAAEGRISPSSTAEQRVRGVILFSVILLTFLLSASFVLPLVSTLDHKALALRSLNLAVGLLYMIALVIFLRRSDWRAYSFQHWFVISLICLVFSQALFASLIVQAGDSVHVTAYALRLVAYTMALVALVSSTRNLFRQASSAQLEERINDLIARQGSSCGPDRVFTNDKEEIIASGTFELDLVSGQMVGNRAAIEVLGGLDGALAARTLGQFVEMIHPDDRSRMAEALRRSQQEGELFKQEYRIKTAGDYRWLESIGGIETVDGKPAKLLGFVHDVSLRKVMELEKEQLYHDLNQMNDALDQHAVAVTADPAGRIQAVNERFCEFSGLAESDLLGKPVESQVTLAGMNMSAGEIARFVRAGNTWFGTISHCGKEGVERIASASISPHWNSQSQVDKLILIGFDVSAQAAAERALLASIEAHKKSNDDLQVFAHIVSHDLQEPLRMVSSFMTLLERRYAADLNQEAREFIHYAVEGSTRMRNLLDGLLEYSRVQSRSAELASVDLNKCVADAIANLAILIRERGAEIKVIRLPEIQGDGAQIMQLFQNLIANGIKFCRDHPPLITISAQREGAHWQVRVSDNGIGIEPIHYGKIFQLFQRLHARDEFPGSGVGLTVCRRIMERHGGSIEVESVSGQGSTFILNF